MKKFITSLLAGLFFHSSFVYAEAVPSQPLISPEARLEKMNEISKIKDQFCQSILYSEDPEQKEKIASINALLKIEQGLMLEGKRYRYAAEGGAPYGEAAPGEEGAPAKESVTFSLKDIRLSGNAAIPSRELRPLVESYLDRDITLTDVNEMVSSIKRYYRGKGYIAVYVYVPPQNVKEGTLEIAIVEGRLGNLEISGNKWFSTDILKKQFTFKPNEVVTYGALRGDLERLNRHRDIKASAVLKPGAKTGTTDVKVKVEDRNPFHLGADINNRGTSNTGKYRYGVYAANTNLSGRMDELSGRVQFNDRTWALASDYNIPISHKTGTRLGFGVSHAFVDLGGQFADLDVEGEATTYSVYALQPVVRQKNISSTLQLGFDWKTVENQVLGTESGQDDLRILHPGINFEFNDPSGRTLFSNDFPIGLDGSDKEDAVTRPSADGEFFMYRGSIARYQWFDEGVILALKGTTQLTTDRLPPSEQLRLGGAFSVRGYSEGEYLADYGAVGTAEVYVPAFFFPEKWKAPWSKKPLRKDVQLVTFLDYGYGTQNNPISEEEEYRSLLGAGVGLRVRLFEKFYGRFDWGFPFWGPRPNNDSDATYYFGLSYDLF